MKSKRPWYMSKETFEAEKVAEALANIHKVDLQPRKNRNLHPPDVMHGSPVFTPPVLSTAEHEAIRMRPQIEAENERKRQEYLVADKKRADKIAETQRANYAAYIKKLREELPPGDPKQTDGIVCVWIVPDRSGNEVPVYCSGQPAQLHKDDHGLWVDAMGQEARLVTPKEKK